MLTSGTYASQGHAATAAMLNSGPSNDNVHAPRPVRESYALEDFVSTRRFLKVQNQSVSEGTVGRILRVRSPGRLYDVTFSTAEPVMMTLSHCDIARFLQH